MSDNPEFFDNVAGFFAEQLKEQGFEIIKRGQVPEWLQLVEVAADESGVVLIDGQPEIPPVTLYRLRSVT